MSTLFPCHDQQFNSQVCECLTECFRTHRQRVLNRRTNQEQIEPSPQTLPVVNVDKIGSFDVKQYVEQHLPKNWIYMKYKPNIIETITVVLNESQTTENISEDHHEENQNSYDLERCICNCYSHRRSTQPIPQQQETYVQQQWNNITSVTPTPQTRYVYINCDQQVPLPPLESIPEIQPELSYPVPPPPPPPVILPPQLVPIPCPEQKVYIPVLQPPNPKYVHQEVPEHIPVAPSAPIPEPVVHRNQFCLQCCCVPGQSHVKTVFYQQNQGSGGQGEQTEAHSASVIDQLETRINVRYGDDIMTQEGICLSGNYNEQLRVIDFPVFVSGNIQSEMAEMNTTY